MDRPLRTPFSEVSKPDVVIILSTIWKRADKVNIGRILANNLVLSQTVYESYPSLPVGVPVALGDSPCKPYRVRFT